MTIFVCTIGLIAGVLYFSGVYNTPRHPTVQVEPSAPKLVSKPTIEKFKHDARRIGGRAFPAPVINKAEITREPSINSSNINVRRNTTQPPVFLMRRPLVQDITTIISGDKLVTISGIIPVSADKTCAINGEIKPCGKLARTALRGLIRGRTLKCDVKEKLAGSSRIITSCKVGNIDIASWLVKHHWTSPLPGQSK